MKSIQNKKRISKKLIVTVSIVIIAAVIALIYIFTSIKQGETTNTTAGNENKDKMAESNSQKGITPSDTLPKNSQSVTTEDVPVSKSATATITRLEQKDSTVYFDATVSNATQLGKCVVTFTTPNDKPVTREFDAVERNGTYLCSITLSALEFSYLGEWEATLRYYNGDSQVIAKGKVVIS